MGFVVEKLALVHVFSSTQFLLSIPIPPTTPHSLSILSSKIYNLYADDIIK
jgi:hypothetical protein